MKNALLIGLLLLTHEAVGQTYRVGVCPGPLKAYLELIKRVHAIPVSRENSLDEVKASLREWSTKARLSRYVVEIKRLDTRQTWIWRKAINSQSSAFTLASVESTAGRGGGLRAGRAGDNQRCFFQDTTVVLDTLRIRRGDFAETTLPTLMIDGRAYMLPFSPDRTEWLLSAAMLPGLAPEQYHTATVQLGDGAPLSLTLYLLSPDERQQLVESVQHWLSFEPMNCQQLSSRLTDYVAQSWGGKTCAGSALYAFAQRTTLTRLFQHHHIACTL